MFDLMLANAIQGMAMGIIMFLLIVIPSLGIALGVMVVTGLIHLIKKVFV